MDKEAALIMLDTAQRELVEARVKVAHLEQVVDGLTGLLNGMGVDVAVGGGRRDRRSSGSESGGSLRPRDAVLQILMDHPGLPMTPRRIYELLLQEGMVNTEMKSGIAAYDMALRRLAEEPTSGVERDDEVGTYILRRKLRLRDTSRESYKIRRHEPTTREGVERP